MSTPTALIVDDEPDIRELLEITLGRMGISTRSAADLGTARQLLESEHFDLCLTDMRLPDGDGIDLVRHIGSRHPAMPCAVITAHGSMETAISALKAGAFDFISKPVDLGNLRQLIAAALKLEPATPTGDASGQPGTDPERPMLLGNSEAINRVRETILKLGRSQAPVFVSGESGTGKELAAHLIHANSPRAAAPFIAVNSGAIPPDLVESELFGHVKGSFTGATQDKKGLFQSAEGGTLFLDEVADLPQAMQVKLLRAIQERRIRPVGGAQEIPVDIRLISATHKDLAGLVESGQFRQDLYYRLHVIELVMPPLRQHADDIPLLAEHFLIRIARKNGLEKPVIDKEAMRQLRDYAYPGNVRELENILERASALCEAGRITAADLMLPASLPASGPAEPDDDLPLEDYLADIERQRILTALEATRWNRTAAARQLGLSFRALRYRLAKLGIEKTEIDN